jgi:hypothetical protein
LFKTFTAAAIAASLVAAPTIASAQSTAPREVAPASETIQADNEIRGGFILPLAALVALVLAVILLTDKDDEDPISA